MHPQQPNYSQQLATKMKALRHQEFVDTTEYRKWQAWLHGLSAIIPRVSLNTPDERCMCQVRMPCSVGAIFFTLPILAPWRFFGVFFAKFGFYGPKLP